MGGVLRPRGDARRLVTHTRLIAGTECRAGIAALGCDGALNLDGGPSTGVAYWRDGQLHHLPPRGPIRHAVVVRARPDGE